MTLTEWIQERYGLNVPLPSGLRGVPLAEALCSALVDAGADYGQQKAVLVDCARRRHDLDFGNACLDLKERIETFERRLEDAQVAKVGKCHSAVVKNKDWPAAKAYADYRFVAARPLSDELFDGIDSMAERLLAEGYIELREEVVVDLRQGLGYYRPDEDPVRRRRTIRWLKGQNALHVWVKYMLDVTPPLIRKSPGPEGCWDIAASLFCDRNGRAFTNSRLEHGVVKDEHQSRWLRSVIPGN
jgi:hypothetical protein